MGFSLARQTIKMYLPESVPDIKAHGVQPRKSRNQGEIQRITYKKKHNIDFRPAKIAPTYLKRNKTPCRTSGLDISAPTAR